jgi:hypothetical protein
MRVSWVVRAAWCGPLFLKRFSVSLRLSHGSHGSTFANLQTGLISASPIPGSESNSLARPAIPRASKLSDLLGIRKGALSGMALLINNIRYRVVLDGK